VKAARTPLFEISPCDELAVSGWSIASSKSQALTEDAKTLYIYTEIEERAILWFHLLKEESEAMKKARRLQYSAKV